MPRVTSLQQNPFARKTLHRRSRGTGHEPLSCYHICRMYSHRALVVLLRQLQRMKYYYQIILFVVIGLAFICVSRILTETAEDELQPVIVQKSVQSHTRDKTPKGEKVIYQKGPVCGNRQTCRQGQLGFHLISGFENKEKPHICFDDKQIFKKEDTGRGLNMAVVDGNVKEVIVTQRADTYTESPPSLMKFLKKIAVGDILIIVSADDASRKLPKEFKAVLAKDFNSRSVNDLAYRSTWVFIGQKGVKSSDELEKLNLVHGQWAVKIELRGCLSLPISSNTSTIEPQRDASTNCNLPQCESGKFPVSLQSGTSPSGVKLLPLVCVDGRQIMSATKTQDYEPGSRGLNCIVFDPVTMKVVKVGRFDTYNSAVDDSLAQKFLNGVTTGQIVMILAHDESSRKLSFKTKDILKSLGSSKIEDLSYRDNWVFIGQKGIKGFTPFEKLGFREGTSWAPRLEIKDCIPLKIEGVEVASGITNRKKGEFCKQYGSYPNLCSAENINNTLRPLPLDDHSLSNNPAYNLPIIVVPGVDLEPLQKCLSSLVKVPGMKPNNVLVILNGNFPESNDLVRLYDFTIEYIKPKADYAVFLHDAIKQALEMYKGKEYLIILEESLEVTPDFLRYFSQTLHMLAKDPTILTISAWNPNGFIHTSGDESLVYRTDDFPGLGWIIRRSLWDIKLQKRAECCSQPTWRGWSIEGTNGVGSIIPDVSRVKRILRGGGFYQDKRFLMHYLLNRTSSSGSPVSEPTEVYKMESKAYEREIVRLVSHSVPLEEDVLTKCLKNEHSLGKKLEANKQQVYSVFYEQESVDDHTLLRQLCKCFRLFVYEDFPLTNMHQGIIRFTSEGNYFILVGSNTVYFEYKPPSAPVLTNPIHSDDKG